MLVKFSLIFEADIKITFCYNFGAPLKMQKQLKNSPHGNDVDIKR